MRLHLPTLLSNGNKLLEAQQATILSAASIITASSFLSGIVGLLRNRILVTYFYGNPYFDAYWVSFRLPELVFQLLVIGALSAAFIPVFTKYEKKSKEDAFQMASSVLNLMLLGFLICSVVIFIWAVPFTQLITGEGFSSDQILVSAQMTRIMLLAQFFFAISNFLSGTIQSYKRFIIPALSPIAYNFGIILGTILLSPSLGIFGPALGVVMGAFLHVALQLPLARKLGFRYHPQISLKHTGVKEIFTLMIPRTLALSVNQIQLFAIVFFATHLGSNSLTIITLAQQLMTFPIRIFGAPIGQAALPFLSQESNAGEYERFKSLILRSLHQISFFTMPAAVLLLILRIPIVRLAFGAKEFPWSATLQTGWVVAILTLSITAQAMTHVLIRSFYALHDTRRPLIASLSTVAIFLVSSIGSIFFFHYGVFGVALAISLSTIFEAILLLTMLHQQVGGFKVAELWIPQMKMLFASGLMALSLWFPFRTLDQLVFDTSRTIDLIGLTFTVSSIGMMVYIGFAFILDVKELSIIRTMTSMLGGWKTHLAKSPEVVETAGQSDESTV